MNFVTALVPIKTISERLPNKNFLDFNGKPLYQIIIDRLLSIDLIDKIIINTDSKIIKSHYSDCLIFPKIKVIDRPENISGNNITMNTIIDYDISQFEGSHFIQTHCTNPLLKEETIINAIQTYFKNLPQFDSLISVDAIQKRVYNENGNPINHSNFKLEQTQNLPKIFIENSNIFLFSRTSFKNSNNSRIGKNPYFFEMNPIESIDIDYKTDLELAKLIYRSNMI